MSADKRIRGVADTELFDHGPERSRLLVRLWRALALGAPLSSRHVRDAARAAGLEPAQAQRFLDPVSERDAQGRIVGLLGLSLNDHPHRFLVGGRRFSTWCAIDALFLPAMLEASAAVESDSPVSGRTIRLEVDPTGVRALSPAGASVSLPIVRAGEVDTSSVRGLWRAFCHRVHFFADQSEARAWIQERGEMEVVSVAGAWRHAMRTWAKVLATN